MSWIRTIVTSARTIDLGWTEIAVLSAGTGALIYLASVATRGAARWKTGRSLRRAAKEACAAHEDLDRLFDDAGNIGPRERLEAHEKLNLRQQESGLPVVWNAEAAEAAMKASRRDSSRADE